MVSAAEQFHPGSHRIARMLREQIEQGQYGPGEWLPAERTLASEFGVDRSAVRAALAQLASQQLIVREPRRRPWVANQHHPNGTSARRPEPKVPLQTIAMIVPQHPAYPAALALICGANAGLRWGEVQYRLVVFDTHHIASRESAADLEERALNAVENEGIAGVILWHNGGEKTLPHLKRLREAGIPIVLVDRSVPGLVADVVVVDNRSSARDAVQHLISLGHRNIGHLTENNGLQPVLERGEGYREALLSAGIEPLPQNAFAVSGDPAKAMGSAADHFLSLPQVPTAIFAMNDSLAHFFLTEITSRGIRIPEDMSIVGFDDLERFSPRPALLTTVHQPFELIGQRAAELLVRRLASQDADTASYQHLMLPASQVIRSTAGYATGKGADADKKIRA